MSTIYGLDRSKYPPRMGRRWSDAEALKLLNSIKDGRSIAFIAAQHERTIGGINAQRRKMAVQYHFNDRRPMRQIERFTGLTRDQIEDAIRRHEITVAKKTAEAEEVAAEVAAAAAEPSCPTLAEIMAELKAIHGKLDYLMI
jgi:hypothetical protein